MVSKEISQATKIKDLYFELLKSSKEEIMLIFSTNKAFERQERIGIIGLVKQVAKEKDLRVRVLVPVENLENLLQGLILELDFGSILQKTLLKLMGAECGRRIILMEKEQLSDLSCLCLGTKGVKT